MRNGASQKSHTGLLWQGHSSVGMWGRVPQPRASIWILVSYSSENPRSGGPDADIPPATRFSSSSTNPWRNKTTPFGRRSRPCSLSWQDGAGHCICMNDCAEWAVVHALLCCPLDAQCRPSNSQDNLPLMDSMAARNNCSRLLAPLPEPSSLQAHAIMSLLASSLSPCPHCPRTRSW